MGKGFHVGNRLNGNVTAASDRIPAFILFNSFQFHTRRNSNIGSIGIIHHRHGSACCYILQRIVESVFQSLQLTALPEPFRSHLCFEFIGQGAHIGFARNLKLNHGVYAFPNTVICANTQRINLIGRLGGNAFGFHAAFQIYIGGGIVIQPG